MEGLVEKDKYISHLVGLLFSLTAICDIISSKELRLAVSLLSIVAFVLSFPIIEREFLKESMLIILFLLSASLMNLFFTQNNFGGSSTLVGSLFLAYIYIYANKKSVTFWVVASYLITICFISYHIFVLETNANFIYDGLSRNHAGFAVVFWTVFLLFHLEITYKRLFILIPLIGVILAYYLFGRTSLIVSVILLFVVYFYKFKNNFGIRFISILIFIGVCYYLWVEFGAIWILETNLNEGLNTPRWKLWRIYFENINFVNLFTGIDVTTLDFYHQFSGNPHNSFIKFHSRVGIGSLLFILLFFISLFKYLKKKEYYILWLLVILSIRAFFDGDILIGNFDFIFFIITFYWIKED